MMAIEEKPFSLAVALGFEVVFSSLELFPWLKQHFLICDV